jgi:hypothetical protein
MEYIVLITSLGTAIALVAIYVRAFDPRKHKR